MRGHHGGQKNPGFGMKRLGSHAKSGHRKIAHGKKSYGRGGKRGRY